VPIAQDVACIDACVDYRAITDPPDDAWLSRLAVSWARERRGDEYRAADGARRKQIIDEEKKHVRDRVEALWNVLAQAGNRERDEIDEARHEIIRRVEMRRRYVWYRKFEAARAAHDQKKSADDAGSTSWWKQWLIDETQEAPQLDQFEVKVAEQTEAHPILRAISADVQNTLGKAIDELPGLVLRPGMTRSYPWGEAACHVIGHLSRVRREDLENDPYADDDLRKYEYNDLIGRAGMEALCEPLLRGSRGRIERYIGSNDDDKILARKEPSPGKEITATIDIALQQEILGFFQNAKVTWQDRTETQAEESRKISMHGGAVVIDVASGEGAGAGLQSDVRSEHPRREVSHAGQGPAEPNTHLPRHAVPAGDRIDDQARCRPGRDHAGIDRRERRDRVHRIPGHQRASLYRGTLLGGIEVRGPAWRRRGCSSSDPLGRAAPRT
jgi:cell division protein FtsI/penicillin-binding protein 2